MISKILALLMLSASAFAFDKEFKDFKPVNDRIPLEFQHLFQSLKLSVDSPAAQMHFVGLIKEIDENLGVLEKEHIYFLMKSEVIKNVLEFKHTKVRSFDMTTFLLERLNEDFKKKEPLLNPFSQWICRSIIAELNHRAKLGLISSKSFNPAHFDGAKKAEAARFGRYLNYILPWVDKMVSLTPDQFNQLSREVSWITLRRLNERSLLFKRFAPSAGTDTKITLFNIPSKLLEIHPEDIKRMQKNEAPLSLKDESAKEKTKASKEVQNVTPEDLSTLSDEVAKELDEKLP